MNDVFKLTKALIALKPPSDKTLNAEIESLWKKVSKKTDADTPPSEIKKIFNEFKNQLNNLESKSEHFEQTKHFYLVFIELLSELYSMSNSFGMYDNFYKKIESDLLNNALINYFNEQSPGLLNEFIKNNDLDGFLADTSLGVTGTLAFPAMTLYSLGFITKNSEFEKLNNENKEVQESKNTSMKDAEITSIVGQIGYRLDKLDALLNDSIHEVVLKDQLQNSLDIFREKIKVSVIMQLKQLKSISSQLENEKDVNKISDLKNQQNQGIEALRKLVQQSVDFENEFTGKILLHQDLNEKSNLASELDNVLNYGKVIQDIYNQYNRLYGDKIKFSEIQEVKIKQFKDMQEFKLQPLQVYSPEELKKHVSNMQAINKDFEDNILIPLKFYDFLEKNIRPKPKLSLFSNPINEFLIALKAEILNKLKVDQDDPRLNISNLSRAMIKESIVKVLKTQFPHPKKIPDKINNYIKNELNTILRYSNDVKVEQEEKLILKK